MFIPPLSDLPAYHDDLLIVKVRPGAASVAAAGRGTPEIAESPGLSTLSMYERAGLIKRVVPLARPAAARVFESVAPTAAMAGIAMVAASSVENDPAPNAGVMLVELQPGTALQDLKMSLAQDAAIDYVSEVPVRYLMAPAGAPAVAAATPPHNDALWNLKKVGWSAARAAGLHSAVDVRIAVLDTGLDVNHPDMPPALHYVHDFGLPSVVTSQADIVGHGTHVAGTICALINNQIGINGICECAPSCYKIFGDQPRYVQALGYFAFLVDPLLYRAALAECVEQGIQVLNLSIGGYGAPDPQERGLFQALLDSGCTVVAAMGNENTGQPSYPAAIPGVVAVGATSFDDTRAPFSNFGGHIALSAPGVGIWSTLPTYPGRTGNLPNILPSGLRVPGQPLVRETHYAAWQGTSMAAPHVAAAAALMIARHGAMSSADARARLLQATDTVPGMGTEPFTREYGTGRLNLGKLV